ncbi:UDP-glucose 6-dehydrogenase TuaD [termite gut metagenome]|uniref:UDP-glucose 6-dehydrogenase n=1 Tax=termite gut metagenome TaxID=433724 RepID=A0A5J4RTQ2_9ZZZZ
MNISIVGSGYVGLVTGACFSEMGVSVTCVDIDKEKIQKLSEGVMPIYEPGLDELVGRNVQAGRLRFTTDLSACLDSVDVVFIAVGTPADEDGSADLRYVLEVARTVGSCMTRYMVLVTKSTVPVGTAGKVRTAVREELDKRNVKVEFDVVSNPEFLKEGTAITDFMAPDRVVIGVESEKAQKVMEKLYRPFLLNGYPILMMDVSSAEMTKYAANAMLATRISFMNDIANLCERVGADVDNVRKGIGTDSRIGGRFLYAGCGYGGSCFPKDVKALVRTGIDNGYRLRVIEAVESVNETQKSIVFDKLSAAFGGELKEKVIAVWGLSFKPETDDMRESPALVVIDKLIQAGAEVKVYDPIAMEETRRRIGERVTYCKDMYEAVIEADAIALLTEWKVFRMPSWAIIHKAMRNHVVVDGRNIYESNELREAGFTCSRIGRKQE